MALPITAWGLMFSWEHSSQCASLVSWCFLGTRPQGTLPHLTQTQAAISQSEIWK